MNGILLFLAICAVFISLRNLHTYPFNNGTIIHWYAGVRTIQQPGQLELEIVGGRLETSKIRGIGKESILYMRSKVEMSIHNIPAREIDLVNFR